MRIMVIGGGGREHAIIKKLRQSPKVTEIFALPGNGGIARDAVCVPIGAEDLPSAVDFAVRNAIDLAVVGPDAPLVLGAADALEAAGIPCFGPDKRAAIIEGSKVFSKNLMRKYGIPTAAYAVFSDIAAALAYLDDAPLPLVIKADGLALGKGVVIARTREEASAAVHAIMADRVFGDSGANVVIEEFLEGPEVSVLAFTDGRTLVPMVSSMDHKRARDGDEGPNTGGMGTIAPNPHYTPELAEVCMKRIFLPTVAAMNAEGRGFKGCLYFGLMLTDSGPRVIEYNCRFGDPEAQVVLPLLESDLVDIMLATRNGTLAEAEIKFASGAACCVVMASLGYPQRFEKGFEISLPAALPERCAIYAAGVKRDEGGRLLTDGGRVLGLTACADTPAEAVDRAYEALKRVRFENAFYRKDIGQKALAALKKEA